MKDDRINLQQLKHFQVQNPHPLDFKSGKYNTNNVFMQRAGQHKLPVDTPSTSYAPKNHHQISSLAQRHPHLHRHEQTPNSSQLTAKPTPVVHHRINSMILSVQQIKETQTKTRERAMSRNSIKSDIDRKIYVSISKSNKDRSQHKEERGQMSPFSFSNDKEGRQEGKKIKLTRYLQLKGYQKSNKK